MWQQVGYSRPQLLFYLFTKGTDDTQLVRSPDGDVNQADYEADDEASLLPSPADTNTNGGELDDSEHGDIRQFTLGKFENFFLRNFALSILLSYYCYVITQAFRIIAT